MGQIPQSHDRFLFAEKIHAPCRAHRRVQQKCGGRQSCIYWATFSQAAPPPCRNPAVASSIVVLCRGDDAIPSRPEQNQVSSRAVATASINRHHLRQLGMWDQTPRQLKGTICELPYYSPE